MQTRATQVEVHGAVAGDTRFDDVRAIGALHDDGALTELK